MAKTATIQARIDPDVKENAQNVLNQLNISMTEAINIFLTQVSLNRGIPFEIRIPDKLTAETLAESEKGENMHQVSSVDELFQELER